MISRSRFDRSRVGTRQSLGGYEYLNGPTEYQIPKDPDTDSKAAHVMAEPSSPIKMMPTEILEEIFILCFERTVAEYDENIFDSSIHVDVPIQISAVCVRWRQIAHGLPVLWSFIPMNAGDQSRNMDIKKLLEIYLKHSRDQPLRVAIKNLIQPRSDSLESGVMSLFPFTAIPLDRIHHLTLREPKSIETMFNIDISSMTKLDQLTGLDLIGSSGQRGMRLNIPIDTFGPNLRSVRLHRCRFTTEIFSSNNKVESLVLSQARNVISSSYILQLPHIRNLYIKQIHPRPMNSSGITAFQFGSQERSIRHLILEGVFLSSLELIKGNDFSLLTHLSIRSDDFLSTESLRQFVRDVGPTITHLELRDVAWDRISRSDFFEKFEELQYLRICCINTVLSTGKLMLFLIAISEPAWASPRTLKPLAPIEIVARMDNRPPDVNYIRKSLKARRKRILEERALATPTVPEQEATQGFRTCTIQVTEWNHAWCGGWW